jgi:hypothetical protein
MPPLKALIERGLRLRAMRCIHNPQTPRAHRNAAADTYQRVGNVSAMQHAGDQAPDSRFDATPIDGDRYAAHHAPETKSATKSCSQRRSVRLTVGSLLTGTLRRQPGGCVLTARDRNMADTAELIAGNELKAAALDYRKPRSKTNKRAVQHFRQVAAARPHSVAQLRS